LPVKALKQLSENGRLLLLAARPRTFAHWLTHVANEIETLEPDRMLELTRELYLPLLESFDACLIVLTEDKLQQVDEMVARVGPLLRPGGQIMIMVTNERPLADAAGFCESFAQHSARLPNPSAWLTEVYYVPAGRLRWNPSLDRLTREASFKWQVLPAHLPALLYAAVLALFKYVCNFAIRPSQVPPRGLCSSVFLILRPASGTKLPLPVFSGNAIGRGSLALRRAGTADAPPRGENGAEPHQVDRRNDPDGLATTLARYRFVAGLLKSRRDVAQYGADELGARFISHAEYAFALCCGKNNGSTKQ